MLYMTLQTFCQDVGPYFCGAAGWGWLPAASELVSDSPSSEGKSSSAAEEDKDGGKGLRILKMPEEGQGSSLRAVLKQAPGLPSPSREPAREDMIKCQISSIIVTPPKIIGRMFCQSQLMAPTGERATLMVVSSCPGTECSGRVVRD